MAAGAVLDACADRHMLAAGIDAGDLLLKLGVSILMPLVVGKAVRELIKPIRDNICKYKAPLYLINNLQVCNRMPAAWWRGRSSAWSHHHHFASQLYVVSPLPPPCPGHGRCIRCRPCCHAHLLQITIIVWQKLSAAREVLVEQEAGDVVLAGKRTPAC